MTDQAKTADTGADTSVQGFKAVESLDGIVVLDSGAPRLPEIPYKYGLDFLKAARIDGNLDQRKTVTAYGLRGVVFGLYTGEGDTISFTPEEDLMKIEYNRVIKLQSKQSDDIGNTVLKVILQIASDNNWKVQDATAQSEDAGSYRLKLTAYFPIKEYSLQLVPFITIHNLVEQYLRPKKFDERLILKLNPEIAEADALDALERYSRERGITEYQVDGIVDGDVRVLCSARYKRHIFMQQDIVPTEPSLPNKLKDYFNGIKAVPSIISRLVGGNRITQENTDYLTLEQALMPK